MEINKITTTKIQTKHITTDKQDQKLITTDTQHQENNKKLLMELDNMANRNNISFKGNFELNLSNAELDKRTNKDYLVTKKMLKADSPEYLELAQGDKEALKHLVKAAYILEKINMQLDCHHNLEFKKYLENETAKGNKQAELTKILFDAQKGMNAIDTMSN